MVDCSCNFRKRVTTGGAGGWGRLAGRRSLRPWSERRLKVHEAGEIDEVAIGRPSHNLRGGCRGFQWFPLVDSSLWQALRAIDFFRREGYINVT